MLLLPIALSLAFAGCGNKGPLVLPPPSEDDALLLEADAVDDADEPPLPADAAPVEATPEPTPDSLGDGDG